MTSPGVPPDEYDLQQTSPSNPHRLELEEVDLIENRRQVAFRPGLNIIQGHISTGKTTLVRLIRALLGTLPDDLPPETEYVSAIKGRVVLGDETWTIYRPRVSTANALVQVIEDTPEVPNEPEVWQLPVSGRGMNYSTFLLESLSIPAVSVPTARARPTESLSPVTMTDWLGYCIIPGDELDTQVFGHEHPFRDGKRRWVFELIYGYYDPEVARLASELRSTELRLQTLEREAEVQENFLADTPFSDREMLSREIKKSRDRLEFVRLQRMGLSSEVTQIPGVREVREALLSAQARRADLTQEESMIRAQVRDLEELCRQLATQYDRLTRAIVADEWLVDFDFIVCPRCGSDVDPGRVGPDLCYLCQQPPQPTASRDQLLTEQSRINSQIAETRSVAESRDDAGRKVAAEAGALDRSIAELSARLNQLTESFVSERAARLEEFAAFQARVESDILRLEEYRALWNRHEAQLKSRAELEDERYAIAEAIEGRELSKYTAEANVRALESRMLEYLRELHIPELGQELTVQINRKTYLPIVSGRSFDRLSSQGLKTLVNVAHALAHHTVAIDRGLPLPGFLVLDGLSANAGSEGFDQDRINDMYRLLVREAEKYRGRLQIVGVDNELPRLMFLELSNYVVLTLTQKDRLIRLSPAEIESRETSKLT